MIKYNTYKNSGIDWLGEIPEHWDLGRIKDITKKIGSGVTPKGGSEIYVDKGIPFLRSQNIYNDGLRIDDVSFITETIHSKMRNSQLKPNDILINITGASIGRTCIVPLDLKEGNINQHIIYVRCKESIVPFVSNYFKTNTIKEHINRIQAGTSKEALNMGQVLTIPIVIPPLKEQKTIATYLDRKTKAIDQKINLLTQKTAKYKELRKAIINQTVTKGLDKTVKLKDSGIEWIGEIPEHWEVKRLKDLTIISTGSKNSEDYDNDGTYPFFVRSPNIKKINTFSYEGEAVLTAGDGDIGKIFHYINGKFDVHQRVYCVSGFNNKLNAKYFYYYLSSKLYNQAMINNSNSIVNSLRLPLFRNFEIIISSTKEEQTGIANYLDEKTGTIDAIVSNIKSQINHVKRW